MEPAKVVHHLINAELLLESPDSHFFGRLEDDIFVFHDFLYNLFQQTSNERAYPLIHQIGNAYNKYVSSDVPRIEHNYQIHTAALINPICLGSYFLTGSRYLLIVECVIVSDEDVPKDSDWEIKFLEKDVALSLAKQIVGWRDGVGVATHCYC
jgi:hypothetical protein